MHYKAITIAGLSFAFIGMSSADAEVLLAKSRTADFVVPAGGPVSLPLDEKDNTVLNFKTKKKGIVVIIFNAECAATGDAGNWIGLQIFVDGKATNPKVGHSEFAFCSATGIQSIYTAVSRQSYMKVGAGSHTVEVIVSRQGVNNGHIDDGSIVVTD